MASFIELEMQRAARHRASSLLVVLCLLGGASGSHSIAAEQAAATNPTSGTADPFAWPAITQSARPWTRWWWLGSAVDDANLTRLLKEYHKAGLGGVEITCIYGVRGAEDRNLPYLSDQWRDAVHHTLVEAKRLGLGVDLPTGSGWRTGGPSVSENDANLQLVIKKSDRAGSTHYRDDFDSPPHALVAYGNDGRVVDLLDLVEKPEEFSGGYSIDWQIPDGTWTVYTVSANWSRDNVKRPAPGGEGRNINPLSRRAINNYLAHFGERIEGLPAAGIRAQFHDSYEYEGNWCDDFFAQFEKRRGYRLQDYLPELSGEGSGDDVARIKHDYRETVSDLILEELIEPWTEWSHQHGMLSRNQGHGSPGNWLDIYAAVDIPETESFGRLVGGDGHPLVFKFASSAAHVAGRELVSAETATWLDEHFTESLGQVKEMVDRLLLSGVNHIVYHGTAYSPADAKWPGWLFYASTQLNPQNPIWRDFPALNEYVARCQAVLQSTRPDNDILLYWPIHDYWTDYRGLRKDLRVHNARGWLFGTPFGRTAQWLDEHGYTFDYVSDRQILACKLVDGKIETPGGRYASIVIPAVKHLPLATLRKLVELAEAGADIVFIEQPPGAPPGRQTEQQLAEWNDLYGRLKLRMRAGIPWRGQSDGYTPVHFLRRPTEVGHDAAPRFETWGRYSRLSFLRRHWDGGHVYLIKNQSDQPFDDWINPAIEFQAAILMNPLDGRVGLAETRDDGKEVRLQLAPHQTIFLKTSRAVSNGPKWNYDQPQGELAPITGEWSVEFLAGGPELPPPTTIDALESWTNFAAPEGERFAGTARYKITFAAPAGPGRYRLHLGKVADSAKLQLNGKPVATLIAAPFDVDVDLQADNELTIDVTNVAANRIRDLDRRKIPWRIFHDINLVSISYGRFDASTWPVRDAGLLGPVTLQRIAAARGDDADAAAAPAKTPAAAARQMESLDRGVVAVRQDDGKVFISWRVLGTDPDHIAFNIFRKTGDADPVKLNDEPLTGPTHFIDDKADLTQPNTWSVSPPYDYSAQVGGEFTLAANSPARPYVSIPLQTPEGYSPGDASVGDLDGDGQYEIVVHQVGRGRDNSQRGETTEPILQAYRLDGTLLWAINLGRNIREGAHYTQFMVYDLDGDGRAEVACKTADGTIDGVGKPIGDRDADHRNDDGLILEGPEFLTVFDGRTGAALATTDYIPPRGDVEKWGDDYGNRVDRFLACVAYLDGQRPSLVMCRGYYTRAVLAAWNWRDGRLTHVWTFDTDDGTPGNRDFRGQGNHGISVGDVDGDGRDEIVYGSAVIDDDGTGLYATGFGHGDAMHFTDIDPDRPGLEVFKANGDRQNDAGIQLRDARTGEQLFGLASTGRDGVGRACALDIDPRHKGLEMWGKGRGIHGLFNAKGERISGRSPRTCNMGIWWDGDLSRELLNGVRITKWDPVETVERPVFNGSDHGCRPINGSKSNPNLCADILGDWREEIVAATNDGDELRIFTTTIPTTHRLPTLMHDPIYRLGVAWQNVSYNQPAHTSFYLGEEMSPPPRPELFTPKHDE